jgi:nitrite reductase/ring-hydroxylating ferredoxin subunit
MLAEIVCNTHFKHFRPRCGKTIMKKHELELKSYNVYLGDRHKGT